MVKKSDFEASEAVAPIKEEEVEEKETIPAGSYHTGNVLLFLCLISNAMLIY